MSFLMGTGAASLARTASIALADNALGLGYAISHNADRPWYFLDVLESANRDAASFFGRPGSADAVWTEAMGSAAFGCAALVLVTRTGSVRERVSYADVAERFAVIEDRTVQAFMGTALPNPSFLYRGSRYTEVFLRIPTQGQYDLSDALALAAVLRELSAAAVEQHAPILFLQSPAAAPGRSPQQVLEDDLPADVTNDAPWRRSQAFGVRFAIGLDPLGARGRMSFFSRLGEFATRRGLAVWLGDRRGDRRGGQWFRTVGAVEQRYQDWVSDCFGSCVGVLPTHGYPVTVVGPARVGSSHEIFSRLASVGVPILAASIAALEDLAIIHLVVPVKRSSDGVSPLDQRRAGPVDELLTRFVGRHGAALVSSIVPGDEQAFRVAVDYVAYGGQLVRIHPYESGNERAVWCAWQVPNSATALSDVLAALMAAITVVTGAATSASIDYLLSRRVSNGALHGRCKLAMLGSVVGSIVVPEGRNSRNEMCQRIESAWRSGLSEGIGSSQVEVEVAWRELWLGRWASVAGSS